VREAQTTGRKVLAPLLWDEIAITLKIFVRGYRKGTSHLGEKEGVKKKMIAT